MKKFYSQYEQDKVLYNTYFENFNNGFFLEVGADDGIDKSNTKFFEDLGWDGICIEPSYDRFEMLTQNRKCLCVNKAVSKERGRHDFLDILGYGKGLSGLVKNYDPRHVERIEKDTESSNTFSKRKIQVESLPLSEILEENNISKIDYCSIDVEGSEIDLLESIDFKAVDIYLMTVEDNYNERKLRKYINKINYKVVQKIGPDLVCMKRKRSIFRFK